MGLALSTDRFIELLVAARSAWLMISDSSTSIISGGGSSWRGPPLLPGR
jgi:hypothetical protein